MSNVKSKEFTKWSLREDNYVLDNLGRTPITSIARRLKRADESVVKRVERLRLGKVRNFAGLVTAHELASLLHVDSHTVLLWINKYELPHVRLSLTKERENILIDPQRFWKWAYHHKEKINTARFPEDTLPPEPQWVKEKRCQDRLRPKREQMYWTKEEESQLLWYNKLGLKQREIGELMNRSTRSVQKKLSDIRKMGSKEAKSNKPNPWLKADDDKLVGMIENGCSKEEAAKTLNRSIISIERRITHLVQIGKLELKKQGKKWSSVEDALLLKLLSEGKTRKEIAHELNRSLGSVKGKIDRIRKKSKR